MGGPRLTENDPHSYARPDNCLVTGIHLDVQVDFQRKIIAGFAEITCKKLSERCSCLVLDTQDLTIKGVTQSQGGPKLDFSLAEPDPIFGSKLEVQLRPKHFAGGNCTKVCVEYETSPSSSALQWLRPEQTAGKLHPYLYSHCEPIHCRAMLPCQDTPSVKMPYTASVRAPKELTVLMSAIREGCEECGDGATRVTKFIQKVPVPAYLIAIAVGEVESRKLGPRCTVWAEKKQVDLAVIDFEDTEQMLCSAESLVGPYLWDIYGLLVLPPSFPYGGMENPCLTFATPSLLAGDKSLADVVAHEIAHSWTGNLVTNKTFEHFWLNEGFTMFLERKIIGRLFGNEMREFQALRGIEDLEYAVETMGADNPLTCLVPCLSGVHPDEAFSSVPYEKGHTFLYYLETLLGGPDVFDKFLLSYIEKYKFQSVDTWQWKTYLYDYFKDKTDILNKVDWNAWFHSPGMPPVLPSYSRALVVPCEQLCAKWANPATAPEHFSSNDLASFKPSQICLLLSLLLKEFIGSLVVVTTCPNMHSTKWYSQPTKRRIGHGNVLLAAAILFTGCSPTQSLRLVENAGICSFSKRTYDRIPKDILFPAVYQKPLPADRLLLLTSLYKMEEVGNAEIKFRWLRLGLRAKWEPIVPHVCRFLQTYGRMKFVCPLFRDLHAWEEKRQLTQELFDELKPQMMHVVTLKLSKDLGLS